MPGAVLLKNFGSDKLQSTTGTSINNYITWLVSELSEKQYGEVCIRFTVVRGQVVDVRKESIDTEHHPLEPLEKSRLVQKKGF